ncbi:MAG: sugar-binding protein [Melioribacteraceae bacterium]
MIKKISLLAIQFLLFNNLFAFTLKQSDTLFISGINSPPTINALIDDDCWTNVKWNAIDNVWLKYGEKIDSLDFSGQYKLVWSSTTNLLYFLVEVTDDIFVDGWPDSSESSYPSFDIIEVFIDQDKSGGKHTHDGTGEHGIKWGTNAENAFAYHLNIDLPITEDYATECVVNDIAGTSWNDSWDPDYKNHFPEIALREKGGKYYWEFSLKVFDDTYNHNSPDSSLVKLKTGDIMGLTLAYCENDDLLEKPKRRDSFIGSVWVSEEAQDSSWIDADLFGTIKLVSTPTSVEQNKSSFSFKLSNNYPNPFNPNTVINFAVPKTENVHIQIFNSLGQLVITLVNEIRASGEHKIVWDGKDTNGKSVTSGIYLYKIETGEFTSIKKMSLIR